jgi:hypothetical protein
MEKTELNIKEKIPYFSIRMSNGNFYMGHVVDHERVFKIENKEGSDVITSAMLHASTDSEHIRMTKVFVIVETSGGPVPVQYEKMPGGSKILWLSVNNIAEFNVIDSSSKLVTALDAIDSGVIPVANPEIEKSSRGVSKS